MAREFKPREHQPAIIQHIVDRQRSAVFARMGMGKTVCVLTAFEIKKFLGDFTGPVLVVAPLRVAQSVWPQEVKEWEHLKHLTVSPILGNPKERRRAMMRKADIYTINYDNIPWLIDQHRAVKSFPYGAIVADEGTNLKGFRLNKGSKRAAALARVSFRPPVFVDLTGTPNPNGLKDLWGHIWFVDGGERLGRTHTGFMERWFQRGWDGYSVEPLPHAQKEIQDRLKDICFAADPNDYYDIDKPITNNVMVDMPAKAEEIYRDMEKKMFADLGEMQHIEAVNAGAKTMKCLQLANGIVYTDTETKAFREVHREKIHALESIIEEAEGAPMIVAYHFKTDLERLTKHFKKGRVLDKKQSTIDDWNKGRIPILFAHPQSAGHGLNLQHGGHHLTFFSLNWNLEHHDQIIERIGPMRQMQSGYDRPVYIHYILARNTVDEIVRERMDTKASVQQLLLNAMKKRKEK